MLWKSHKSGHYTKKFRDYNGRRLFAILMVVLFAVAVAGRLFFLQVIRHNYYVSLASRQQGFQKILEPKRGDIYFRTKECEPYRIVSTKIGALIYIDARRIQDAGEVFGKLDAITEIDRAVFDKIIKKTEDPYQIFKKNNKI